MQPLKQPQTEILVKKSFLSSNSKKIAKDYQSDYSKNKLLDQSNGNLGHANSRIISEFIDETPTRKEQKMLKYTQPVIQSAKNTGGSVEYPKSRSKQSKFNNFNIY